MVAFTKMPLTEVFTENMQKLYEVLSANEEVLSYVETTSSFYSDKS